MISEKVKGWEDGLGIQIHWNCDPNIHPAQAFKTPEEDTRGS